MSKTTTAIYAGTFDPLTVGHVDLVERASKLFDVFFVGIGINPKKKPMFEILQRFEMAQEVFKHIENIQIISFKGLLVETVLKVEADVIVRGLRMFSDFESEFQMALANRDLLPTVETIFLTPKHEHSYISSSMVKEIWVHGGDIKSYVPAYVYDIMENIIRNES